MKKNRIWIKFEVELQSSLGVSDIHNASKDWIIEHKVINCSNVKKANLKGIRSITKMYPKTINNTPVQGIDKSDFYYAESIEYYRTEEEVLDFMMKEFDLTI